MKRVFRSWTILVAACAVTASCAPVAPSMTLEEAKEVCRERVAKPVDTRVGVGLRGGSGGKISTGVGLSVDVDVNAARDPQGTYIKCVKRNSGHDVTATLEG